MDARTHIDPATPIFPKQVTVANGYMIADPDAVGAAQLYSVKVGKLTAAAHGWTDIPGDALQFARRQDAEDFAERFLPNMNVRVVGRNGG